VDAIIDLNQSVDSSEDASCHARKIRPQPPISNGRQAKNNFKLRAATAKLLTKDEAFLRARRSKI
jgi:hypothetical protein